MSETMQCSKWGKKKTQPPKSAKIPLSNETKIICSLQPLFTLLEAVLSTSTLRGPDTLVPHFEKLWDRIPEMDRGRGSVPTDCRVSSPCKPSWGPSPHPSLTQALEDTLR